MGKDACKCGHCAKCFGRAITNVVNIKDDVPEFKKSDRECIEELQKMMSLVSSRTTKLRSDHKAFSLEIEEIKILVHRIKYLEEQLSMLKKHLKIIY